MIQTQAPLNVPDMAAPWEVVANRFGEQLKTAVPFDGLVLGVSRFRDPHPDELLAVSGWTHGDLMQWFDGMMERDPLAKMAVRRGVGISSPQTPLTQLPQMTNQHAVFLVIRERMVKQRWWYMILTRRDDAFSEMEIATINILLQQWQCQFLEPCECQMGRVLLGHDDRLLLADLSTQAHLVQCPAVVDELVRVFRPVAQQRYPSMEDNKTYDIALTLGSRSTWICFRRRQAMQLPQGTHWYLELRPLDDPDLARVGLVEDDRVAAALGYIHARYRESPNLDQIASSIQMSHFHFHRLFSRQVGISPKRYLLSKQLQVAKWLLRTQHLSIGVVAERSGFSSHGHFTSTFRRVVGLSPTEYRESF